MAKLKRVLQMLDEEIAHPKAKVTFLNHNTAAKMEMLGTRDGVLHLARVLIEAVHDAESGRLDHRYDATLGSYSDDRISDLLYQLPDQGMETWVDYVDLFASADRLVNWIAPRGSPAERRKVLAELGLAGKRSSRRGGPSNRKGRSRARAAR